MKGFGYREVGAIADTVGGLLIADYATIRIIAFVVAVVPVAIIMVALDALAFITIFAVFATTAAFSHIFLYKGYIKKRFKRLKIKSLN
jgi:hypothetical protein